MAHWCFQLLCILKTRMSWKSLCLLFFISTKTRFYWIEKILLATGDFWNGRCGYSDMWPPCCWSLPWEWSMLLSAVESNCSPPILSTEHCNTPFFPTHYPPPFLLPHPRTPQSIIAIFQSGDFDIISSHLALRTWSVFLILTKINLLFSRWILPACKCCDSHIQ